MERYFTPAEVANRLGLLVKLSIHLLVGGNWMLTSSVALDE